jgi:hypothetical protein
MAATERILLQGFGLHWHSKKDYHPRQASEDDAPPGLLLILSLATSEDMGDAI